jgi:hypothetical protein
VPSRSPRVLLADDQRDILEALQLLLKSEGFQVQSVSSPAAVLAAIDEADFDAALIDLNYARDTTSGQEGAGPAGAAARPGSDASGHRAHRVGKRRRRGRGDASRARAISCRSRGTTRGCSPIVRTQVELSRALRRGRQLEGAARLSFDGAPPLIARSPAMKPVIELIERTAPSMPTS